MQALAHTERHVLYKTLTHHLVKPFLKQVSLLPMAVRECPSPNTTSTGSYLIDG